MTDSPRGLPLLSGPPPEPPLNDRSDMSCRKCNKEFNILFARGRRCNHCGYSYCYSCSDYQALMPRRGDEAGYDCMPVCAFCIQYLQITAGGKGFLRSLPLAKLKNYMQAYGLRLGADVLEKDDIINAIIAARTETGCLPKVNENYYRKHSVPSGQTSRPRGLFSRSERTQPRQYLDPQTGWSQPSNFARPDLQEEHPHQNLRNQYAPPPGPPPYATYNPPRHNPYIPNPAAYRQYQRSNSVPHGQPPANSFHPGSAPTATSNQRPNSNPSSRPSTAPPPQQAPPQQQPPPPPHPPTRPRVPTLDELLAMQEEEISALSIGVLKDVLDNNHVRPGPVLEKSELVARVNALVADERRERVHAEAVREREAWEAQERQWAARERERDRAAREARQREERENMEKEEQRERETRRRREAYRTTVESASESDDESLSLPSRNVSDHASTSVSELDQTRPVSPSSSGVEPKKDEDAMHVDSDSVEPADSGLHSRSASPTPSRLAAERSGLCVVCQDEEANIVIIDCGHLALCRACSDLVWNSTRECPLCRTRIVTQARFLRVFKS